MSSALAYKWPDDTQYSDAQKIVLKPNVPDNRSAESEDVSPCEPVEPEVKESPVFVFPVNELRSDGYKLTLQKSIPVHLEGEGQQFVAIHEDSRICGEGKDIEAAFRDFGHSFISIYFSYVKSEDTLSSGGKEYSNFLKQLVKQIEEI